MNKFLNPILGNTQIRKNAYTDFLRLDNGVRIILDPIDSLKSASVGVWVNVGTRNEDDSNNGIAHLLEHLVFKGAGGRNATQIAEDSEERGIYINASTSYERTGFYARCLSDEIEFAINICADLVLEPHFDPKDFELEKNVVISEINEAFDDAEDRVGVLSQMAAFYNQPLGRPILGDEQSLDNINLDMVKNFHTKYLNPANIIVAFGGGINKDEAIDIANKRFGHLKPFDAKLIRSAYATNKHLHETRKIEQFQFVLSTNAPKAGDKQMYASQIMGSVLGGGMASRLFQDLREKRGLVYGIDTYLEKYSDIGRFIIAAGCLEKNASEVIKRIDEHLFEIANYGPNEKELLRAKKTFETSMMLSLENPSSRINAAISQVFILDKIINSDEITDSIRNTNQEQIMEIAKLSLDRSLRASSCIGDTKAQKFVESFII